MNVQDALLTRTTVHAYRDEPVPAVLIDQAIEAAVAAPNHRMTQPWRFTRVGPGARQDLADLAATLARETAEADGRELSRADQDGLRAKLLQAPELVVLSRVLDERPEVAKEDAYAVACAAQNFQVSLWANGVGSKWWSGGFTQSPAAYDRLGIDPATQRIEAFLWIGYPADAVAPRKPARQSLDEVVRRVD